MLSKMTRLAAALALATLSTTAHATTLTTSLAAFRTGVGAAAVTSSPNPGNYDLTQLFLPTTSSIVLNDGRILGLSNPAQVSQPQNGYPFTFSDGFTGELFIPLDANGNGVSTETITLGGSINALGFEVAPFSNSAGQPNFGIPAGPFTVTVTTSAGGSQTVSLPGGNLNTGSTAPQFFGVFGGGISSLTITTSDTEGLAFGNFQDVPEPASIALLLGGVAAASWSRRRLGAGA